jgi:short-subunit dehydrogenase
MATERRLTLITGASSGLGSALAPLLAADGDTVLLAARRAAALDALAQRINAAGGGRAIPLALDVSDHDAVVRTLAAVQAEHGPIDCLIANAGVGDSLPAKALTTASVRRVFDTNVFGVTSCLEAVLPGMIDRGAGHVVGVSSLAGYRGLPGSSFYAASKAALTVLLESLRIELKSYGVDVTTICPGFVKTEMTAKNKHPMPFLMELDDAAREMHAAIRDRVTHCAFPWQLATLVRAGRLLPDAVYDRMLKKQRAVKVQGPNG